MSSTTINDLIEDVLIKIFSYFSLKERLVLSSVSTKWRHSIQMSFSSVKEINGMTVDRKGFYSSDKLFCLLVQKCYNVRHISIDRIITTDDIIENFIKELIEVIAHCSQLKSIHFGKIVKETDPFVKYQTIVLNDFCEEAVNQIIGSYNLETIAIKSGSFPCFDFKRLGPNLRELHLINSSYCNIKTIISVCEGNGRLIKVLSIDIEDREVLSLICDNLKKLKKLVLHLYSNNCDFKRFMNLTELKSLHIKDTIHYNFHNQDFIDLIRALKESRISELKLGGLKRYVIKSSSLQEMLIKCPFIETLKLMSESMILFRIGIHSITQMKRLKHLNLSKSYVDDKPIVLIISSSPLLRQLILRNCIYITNITVNQFIEKAKSLPKEQFLLDVVNSKILLNTLEKSPKNLSLFLKENHSKSLRICHRLYVDT